MVLQNGKKVLPDLANGKTPNYFKEIFRARITYLFMLPGIVFIFIFCYLPMYGVIIAFKDYDVFKGVWGSNWVGLEHFRIAISSGLFWRTFGNTVLLSAYKLLWGFPFPIILALMLNEIRFSVYKKIVQTISYLPHFLSWVIISSFAFSILSFDTGLLNKIFTMVGAEPVAWYSTPEVWRVILVGTHVWKSVGWGSILYLAYISSIGSEVFEAATIDGSTRFKSILYITLPSLGPIIAIVLIFSMSSLAYGDFEQVYALTGGNNGTLWKTTDILETYIYRIGIVGGQYSYTAAIGLFKSLLGTVLILLTNWVIKKFEDDRRFRLY